MFSSAGETGEKGDKGDNGEDGIGIKGSPGAPGAPGTYTCSGGTLGSRKLQTLISLLIKLKLDVRSPHFSYLCDLTYFPWKRVHRVRGPCCSSLLCRRRFCSVRETQWHGNDILPLLTFSPRNDSQVNRAEIKSQDSINVLMFSLNLDFIYDRAVIYQHVLT